MKEKQEYESANSETGKPKGMPVFLSRVETLTGGIFNATIVCRNSSTSLE
jgi:hypothetical protein